MRPLGCSPWSLGLLSAALPRFGREALSSDEQGVSQQTDGITGTIRWGVGSPSSLCPPLGE